MATMHEHLSVIGPGWFMDRRGRSFVKTAESVEPLRDKYTEAENRFIERHLEKGAWEDYE